MHGLSQEISWCPTIWDALLEGKSRTTYVYGQLEEQPKGSKGPLLAFRLQSTGSRVERWIYRRRIEACVGRRGFVKGS